jgi:hypothetical protein
MRIFSISVPLSRGGTMMAFFTIMRILKGLGINISAWRSFISVVLTDIMQTICKLCWVCNYATSTQYLTLTIITRVTIVTMQLVVPNSNISSHQSITQLNMTNTAFEAVNVIEQPQAFDYHCCTTACKSWNSEKCLDRKRYRANM